ncbi:type II secretion system GspH family protein [bacterium]|nr:type II secretion system GspH family protein [bacterium]
MKTRTTNRSGFTVVELVTVMAVILVLSGIMITAISGTRGKATVALALDQLRDIQKVAEFRYTETMSVPAIGDLQGLYGRGSSKNITDKYAVINLASLSGTGGDAKALPAGAPSGEYAICSLYAIPGAAYVYSIDDNPPKIAAAGTDPLGVGNCGAGVIPESVGDDDSDDDSGDNGDDGDDDGGDDDGDDDVDSCAWKSCPDGHEKFQHANGNCDCRKVESKKDKKDGKGCDKG